MQNDVAAATSFVEGEVRRLLSGNCEAWELVMTVRTLHNYLDLSSTYIKKQQAVVFNTWYVAAQGSKA